MKNTKGITLIALIITIIILLILTGVTMNIAVNGGLFNNAQRAVDDTNAKVSNTQDRVDELSGILDDVVSQRDEHNWYRAGDNLTCSHCGLSLVIGDYLGYTPDTTSQTVTVTATESGDEGNQTFTQEAGNYWKVLGIEDGDGNGTNETLLIKRVNPTETLLYLAGAEGYNNGVEILNKICKELYSSSRYGEARSIKIEDINNCFQYKPTGGTYMTSDGTLYETNGFNTQIKDLPIWDDIKANGTNTPDGTNTEAKLGEYKIDGYGYMAESPYYLVNPTTKSKTYISLTEAYTIFYDINSDWTPYWLASSGIGVTQWASVAFGIGIVIGPGNEPIIHSGIPMFESQQDRIYGFEMGICPVVCLKDEIPPKINGPEVGVSNE